MSLFPVPIPSSMLRSVAMPAACRITTALRVARLAGGRSPHPALPGRAWSVRAFPEVVMQAATAASGGGSGRQRTAAAPPPPAQQQERKASGGAPPVPSAEQQWALPRVVLKGGKSRLFVGDMPSPMIFSGAVDRCVGRPAPQVRLRVELHREVGLGTALTEPGSTSVDTAAGAVASAAKAAPARATAPPRMGCMPVANRARPPPPLASRPATSCLCATAQRSRWAGASSTPPPCSESGKRGSSKGRSSTSTEREGRRARACPWRPVIRQLTSPAPRQPRCSLRIAG